MATTLNVNIDVEELHDHSMMFFDSYGRLMAEWAAIERALYSWFALITGMKDGMARSIFYSARTFNARSDLLEATFSFAPEKLAAELIVLKASLKKARAYSAFRNAVVHGEPSLDMAHGSGKRVEVQYVLTQGKNVDAQIISVDDLDTAFENFMDLKTLIVRMLPTIRQDKTLEEFHEQVKQLPNPPNSRKLPMGEASSPDVSMDSESSYKARLARRASAGMNSGMVVRVRARSQGKSSV